MKKQEAVKFDFDIDLAKFTERQGQAVELLDRQFLPGTALPLIKFLLYGGALGGGKSYFLRWILVRLLMNWYILKGLKYVQVMLACADYRSLKSRRLSKIRSEEHTSELQ